MPVDTRHPDYTKALPTWELVETALCGERAVKDAEDIYLPKLSDQGNAGYDAYKKRAQFIEVTQRTHEMLVGFIFRKDPQYVFDSTLVEFMDDATMSGLSFYDWLKDTARTVLGPGRRGTLIDWDDDEGRPFIIGYEAKDIINWKTKRIFGHLVLSMLVLREWSSVFYNVGEGDAPADPFEEKLYEQYRVYEILDDDEGRPYVRCQVWRKSVSKGDGSTPKGTLPGTGPTGAVSASGTEGWILLNESMPARGGVPLARIPFVFHGPNNFLPAIDRAPMESIARVNFSHYRTSADLENGLHFLGLPQLWAKGFGDDATKLPIGANVAWVSTEQWAQAGYVEVANGFEGLEKAMERKEKQMANLGARMLDSSNATRQPEAYDTVRIRQTGETVTLTNIAIALTQSASKVLQWAQWWVTRTAQNPEDLADDAKVEMNTDFVSNEIQPQQLTALMSAYAQKGISRKTLFFNLQRGDMYPPDIDYNSEVAEIADDTTGLPPVTGTQFGGGAPKPPREKPAPQAGA